MPFFAFLCCFLFFNPFQARSASGIAFFFSRMGKTAIVFFIPLFTLLAMLEGGAEEYSVAYHKQEEWLSLLCCSPSWL